MPSAASDLDSLLSLEQSFFDAGYADGYSHGRIHGLVEGRALGRKHGYDLWEEVGFYTGFARVWTTLGLGETQARAESHARILLELTAQFPLRNPSPPSNNDNDTSSSQIDIAALLTRIRTRYKALCATLGIKPRLHLAASDGAPAKMKTDAEASESLPRNKIWELGEHRAASNGLSF